MYRYTLPLLAIASWWWLTRRASARATHPQAATEETLQQTVADLTTIQELLPHLPFSTRNNTSNSTTSHDQSPNATKSTPLYTLLRILAFTYPPYLLLTMTSLVRLRTLLVICGTLAIIHRAPFSVLIRRALWRSAYFRWTVYWIWAKISNTPRPGSINSSQPDVSISVTSQPGAGAAEKAAEKAAEPRIPAGAIRFLFTVYENQRWWMALDWTAALLPGERPSWCSRSLQPCSPPAAFSLPPPTIVYLPAPSSASGSSQAKKAKDGKGSGRVMKRTATWAWEEPEWKVVVRKEGAASTTRVERPLPSLVEEGASTGAGRILRVAGKIRGASVDLSPERKMKDLDTGKESGNAKERERSDGEKGADDGQGHVQGQDEEDEESYTDPDGWVYGDNKWEGGSAKGGMGKVSPWFHSLLQSVMTHIPSLLVHSLQAMVARGGPQRDDRVGRRFRYPFGGKAREAPLGYVFASPPRDHASPVRTLAYHT